jgi:hypothetical protein
MRCDGGKDMKTGIALLLGATFFSLTMFFAPVGHAVKRAELWTNMCGSCHNGKIAPDAEWMREHFRNADEFVAAVKGRGKQCMNILKHDETLARKIAVEIGIRDGQDK